MTKFERFCRRAADIFARVRYKKITEEKELETFIRPKLVNSIIKNWVQTNNDKGWTEETGIRGYYCHLTGTLNVYYRFMAYTSRGVAYYSSIYVAGRVTQNENGTTIFRYSLVYDRLTAWVLKLLGIVCLAPLTYVLWSIKLSGIGIGMGIFFVGSTGLVALLAPLFWFGREDIKEASKVLDIFEKSFRSQFPV